MNEAEAMALIQKLTAEGKRILYAFLLALKQGDAEGLEALEAARAAGDMELVKKVSEQVIEREEDFTETY